MGKADTIRTDKLKNFLATLHSYSDEIPAVSFAKVYRGFVENLSDLEQHIIELEYIAQEYKDEYSTPLTGTLADIASLVQVLALHPEVVFDVPHVFQNATRIVLGLSPNYEEALYTPSYQYAEAYVVLNYLLNVDHKLSPLSTEVADVVAMSVHKDGANYFPDKRVTEVSLPELISGDNVISLAKTKKINELFADEILPAIYSSDDKDEFAKKLQKILSDDKNLVQLAYHAFPMMLLTSSTYFRIKSALKKSK